MILFVCPVENKPKWCTKQCEIICEDDPQKYRLYCFEENFREMKKDYELLSLQSCRDLVNIVSAYYHITPPVVKDGRNLQVAKGGYSKDMLLTIKLPRQYRYRIAVLHETAHCVLQYLSRNREEDIQHHGPRYIRYLLDIYSCYMNEPLDYLERIAKKFGLEF